MDRPREDEGGTKCSLGTEPAPIAQIQRPPIRSNTVGSRWAAKVAERRAHMKRHWGSRWPEIPILHDPMEPMKHSWYRNPDGAASAASPKLMGGLGLDMKTCRLLNEEMTRIHANPSMRSRYKYEIPESDHYMSMWYYLLNKGHKVLLEHYWQFKEVCERRCYMYSLRDSRTAAADMEVWLNFYLAELHYVDDVMTCSGLGVEEVQTIVHKYLDTHNPRQMANLKYFMDTAQECADAKEGYARK